MHGVSGVSLPAPGRVVVGFSTAKGAISWFIRTATRSPASHSFLLYFSEEFGQHMVLEVQGRGFVQVPFEVWMRHNQLLALYQIDRDEALTGTAMQKLGARLGDPYDTFSLIGFLLIYVFGIWDRNDLDDKKKLVCSEMVTLFLRWAEIPIEAHIDRVVPRDLWRLAEESCGSFRKIYESSKGKRALPRIQKCGRVLLGPNSKNPDGLPR